MSAESATPAPAGRRLPLPRPGRAVERAREVGRTLADRVTTSGGPAYDAARRRGGRVAAATSQRLEGVSPAGWTAVAGAVGGIWAGLALGWVELLLLGTTCAVALAVAGVWVLGRTDLAVTLQLEPQRVSAGETATGRVELRNRARRSYFPLQVELAVGRGRAAFSTPALAHDEAHEQLFEIPTRTRSVISVGPVSSVRSDPLSLLRRTRRWSETIDLYVHPRTVMLTGETTGYLRDIEGVTTQDLSSSDVSFHALRDYQPGDDRRAIHWRTTARVGRLMVRQFEETRRSHLLVVLPSAAADHEDETDYETAVSVAASLGRHARSHDREVTLFTTDGLLTGSTSSVLLDKLAGLQPARRPVPLRELVARAAGAVPQASVCALVVGGGTTAAGLRAAHRTLPASVATFAVRCDGAGSTGRRRIGDLDVCDVPDVSWLPRAMRSLV